MQTRCLYLPNEPKSGVKITVTKKDGTVVITNVADGEKGEQGFSPVARFSKSGKEVTLAITDVSGTSSVKIVDGEDGKTPVKGVDYFTDEETKEFQEKVKNEIDIPTKYSELTDDVNTARADRNNNFSAPQTVNGNLTVNGDIVQSGKTYKTDVEEIVTKKANITLRDGAVAGMTSDEFAGLIALLYNGISSGRLGFKADGTAYVGDVEDEQPLLTRAEEAELVSGQVLVWNATDKKAVGSNEYLKSTEVYTKISDAVKPASQTVLGVAKMWISTNEDGETTLNISTEAQYEYIRCTKHN